MRLLMQLLKHIHAWYRILKHFIVDYYHYRIDDCSKQFMPGKKYAFVFLAADYNNLGDLAITYSQECFCRTCIGKDYEIVRVHTSETYAFAREAYKLKRENVIITLIGGGNNGSLYEFLEHPRRFLLWLYKNHKVISFPQTVYFEDTFAKAPYKMSFKFLCKRCNNLTLIARERLSYDSYLKLKKENVLLTPDIVFSLKMDMPESERRDGVAFVLRDDIEKALFPDAQNQIIDYVMKQTENVYFWDTCDISFTGNNEEQLIYEYLKKLSQVSYVVTDRLHGMILCYVSQTPCIVIDNNNYKISSTYNTWLRNSQNFIKMYYGEFNLELFDQFVCQVKGKHEKFKSLDLYFKPIEECMING